MERHARAVDRRLVSVPDLFPDVRRAHAVRAPARREPHCGADPVADRQPDRRLQRDTAVVVSAVRRGDVRAGLAAHQECARGIPGRPGVCVRAVPGEPSAAHPDAGRVLDAARAARSPCVSGDTALAVARAVRDQLDAAGRGERVLPRLLHACRRAVGGVVHGRSPSLARRRRRGHGTGGRHPAAGADPLSVHLHPSRAWAVAQHRGNLRLQRRHRRAPVCAGWPHVLGMAACGLRRGRGAVCGRSADRAVRGRRDVGTTGGNRAGTRGVRLQPDSPTSSRAVAFASSCFASPSRLHSCTLPSRSSRW